MYVIRVVKHQLNSGGLMHSKREGAGKCVPLFMKFGVY